jgi:dolichol-phosphate mannosyltransferase
VGGLAGDVVDGLRAARAPWACVVDADLQQPPEVIPMLLARAERDGADLVVASRHCEHGRAEGLGPIRSLISAASSSAARMLFPWRLRGVTDPMSGFFLSGQARSTWTRSDPVGSDPARAAGAVPHRPPCRGRLPVNGWRRANSSALTHSRNTRRAKAGAGRSRQGRRSWFACTGGKGGLQPAEVLAVAAESACHC